MERKRKGSARLSRSAKLRLEKATHQYFVAVARIRYIMRKVFRLIDEHAKELGLDPVFHQALLQVYGSPNQELRVSALAERLDIPSSFASNIVKDLVMSRLLKRSADPTDMRATIVKLTKSGHALCQTIDALARVRVDKMISDLSPEERAVARSSLMFYVGPRAGVRSTKSRS